LPTEESKRVWEYGSECQFIKFFDVRYGCYEV